MAESKLAKFVEDIIVPPRMVDIIVDAEVLFPLFHSLFSVISVVHFLESLAGSLYFDNYFSFFWQRYFDNSFWFMKWKIERK